MDTNSKDKTQLLTNQERHGISMADILLAFLYANNHTPIASKKKLFTSIKYFQEKLGSAFKLKETITEGEPYVFEYGEYGYWCPKILDDIEMFVDLKMIAVRKLENRNYVASTYFITNAGKKVVELHIYKFLSKTQILILSQLKDMALSNAI